MEEKVTKEKLIELYKQAMKSDKTTKWVGGGFFTYPHCIITLKDGSRASVEVWNDPNRRISLRPYPGSESGFSFPIIEEEYDDLFSFYENERNKSTDGVSEIPIKKLNYKSEKFDFSLFNL